MNNMFKNATEFNDDISNWVTSKVYFTRNMFQNATKFNGDISNLDTSKTYV